MVLFFAFPPVFSPALRARTVDAEKNANFDERTIENENSHLQSMACGATAVFATNEGWLGVGAYD
jgi:hypothetical protein